jgi:hypothetical protein
MSHPCTPANEDWLTVHPPHLKPESSQLG